MNRLRLYARDASLPINGLKVKLCTYAITHARTLRTLSGTFVATTSRRFLLSDRHAYTHDNDPVIHLDEANEYEFQK